MAKSSAVFRNHGALELSPCGCPTLRYGSATTGLLKKSTTPPSNTFFIDNTYTI